MRTRVCLFTVVLALILCACAPEEGENELVLSEQKQEPTEEEAIVESSEDADVVRTEEVFKILEAPIADGEKITLSVIGKKDDNTDRYGVREVEVYKGEELIQSILIQEAIGLEGLQGIGIGYSECASKEESAELKDINFDGYLDLEVGACIPNNSIPYYYWCWNQDNLQFEYAFCIPLIDIDEDKEQLITWYKEENGLYYTDYYRIYADNTLELVNKEVEDVRPKDNTESKEKENLGTGEYLKEIDWESISARIKSEEAEAVQRYRQVLEGEEFIWIYQSGRGEEPDTYTHAQKKLTIQEMHDEKLHLNGIESREVVVDSFVFADVFQSGEENICLLLRDLGWYWLILHEEDGVIYGIDLPVRWFSWVQKDGLYYGSGGVAYQYYHRMKFENGDYSEEDIGEVNDGVFFIDGVEQSEADYQAWIKENVKEEAEWYAPVE